MRFFADVTTTERMVRYCFAIGAVLAVCYDIIYHRLRFSMFGIKVDNVKLTNSDHLSYFIPAISYCNTRGNDVSNKAIKLMAN
jgi:hypothetical protein